MVEMPPMHHELVKEVARLRKTSNAQVFRDIISEGLDRLAVLFK